MPLHIAAALYGCTLHDERQRIVVTARATLVMGCTLRWTQM